MDLKWKIRKVILVIFLVAFLSYILPFAYFMAFPATGETTKWAQQLPKGFVVEYCLHVYYVERNEKQTTRWEFSWAAPETFAFSLYAPPFIRCGYLPWVPFIKYPAPFGTIQSD